MNAPVEQWLNKYWQKKDVPTENIEAISRAAFAGIGALRAALSDIGITIKQNKLREFEKVRMKELVSFIQEATHTDVMKTTKSASSLPSYAAPKILHHEGSDRERVREAVEKAVELGIVREEVFPSDASNPRDIYILSSSHYGNSDFDPTKTPRWTKEAQAQLFQLTYLLDAHQAQSPIFVEGRTYGMGYNHPMRDHWIRNGCNLDNHAVQERLFEHPEKLIHLMDQHQIISGKTGVSTPVFYEYTPYKKIAGAHSLETEKLLQDFSRIWLPWEQAFQEKYAGLHNLWKGEHGQTVQFNIGTGWQGNQALLEIAGKWFFAHDIQKDCENYFRFIKELNALDIARENDVSHLMHETKPDLTPMAFMGLAHTMRVKKLITSWATTHVLTPAAVMHKDHLRSDVGVDNEQAPILSLEKFTKLHTLACNVPPLKQS